MVFLLMFLLPLTGGLVVEYLFCRVPRRRFWRGIPPVGLAVLGALALWGRYSSWGEGSVPVETLLIFPGIPLLALALGLFLGWRLWHWLWDPRVVEDRKNGTGFSERE